ncbi:hypothetical protein [Legionella shakespearei]|uniref:Coiled-coil protein n=1 Tax=Legionella shakespearei DSM 23087 TaxID=1122169 RepID=A0A0W0YQR9_9GAMM|nr:hypothetical protein [Legionella shakespearei]KTD59229.1 hypothetical protein Lsha_1925 [Legionella shakespearei DSM 23087]
MPRKYDLNIIYREDAGHLGDKIDYAWSVYQAVEPVAGEVDTNESEAKKKAALMFLIYALDIQDSALDSDRLNHLLRQLIDERQLHKTINPEYIPGKSPSHLPFSPQKTVPLQTTRHGKSKQARVKKGIKTKEILDVHDDSKKEDQTGGLFITSAVERAQYRVNIHQGLFKKNGVLFDTHKMISHGKPGFASFTLNANGELSVFSHLNKRDGFTHATMNAGAPIVAAGEIKIENGQLKAITTYSGHYQPSLFNVYRLLEYFSQHNVDISHAVVITFQNPSLYLPGIESHIYYINNVADGYRTPASQIYNGINELISTCIKKLQPSPIDKLKTKLPKSELTKQRVLLHERLQHELLEFQNNLKSNLSPFELHYRLVELEGIISRYEEQNNALSQEYGKQRSKNHLANTLLSQKKEIDDFKTGKKADDADHQKMQSMKKIY